ncbi:MAG: ATP-binding protein [Bacillus sp. (in: Bacteria)]|nr:ATP-binding protein [Bacillus sp. (in: firmicutes)]
MLEQGDDINYKSFIPRKNGFIFKFVKMENQYIHTFIEGELIQKVGIHPNMIIGKTVFDFLPEEVAREKTLFYDRAWNGEIVNYEGHFGGVYYLATLNPIVTNSDVVEVLGTAIDITVEKEREIQVQKMEKLSVVGELAAGIAHEIRNPLTAIKGFTQLVKENVEDEKLHLYLNTTMDELNRINEIVNEFMVIAKPDENLHMKLTDINLLVKNVINIMEPQANLQSVIIIPQFEASIMAECDLNKIKQVLINILKNAMEAINHKNAIITVILRQENEDGYVIEIIDDGCGISEDRQKSLFEPFFFYKRKKEQDLGLMICKRIIDIHNGSIEIISTEELGTTVKINLPTKNRQP